MKIPVRLTLTLVLGLAASACSPGPPMRDGEWLRSHHEEVRRSCQPVLDALVAHFAEHERYPAEDEQAFQPHAQWLETQRWNWTYYTEPDFSAFCLGIGDRDMDGISVVWCSRHGAWVLDTSENGLVALDPLPLE